LNEHFTNTFSLFPSSKISNLIQREHSHIFLQAQLGSSLVLHFNLKHFRSNTKYNTLQIGYTNMHDIG